MVGSGAPVPTGSSSFRFPVVTQADLRRFDVPGPRYTSYPTVPEWSDAFGPADFARALEEAGRTRPNDPLSVYVHIPFCREMCAYCGCNVVVCKDSRKADRYLDALALEIGLVAERLGPRRRVSRLHLGGGTPTFLDERQLLRLFELLHGAFRFLPEAELAIEIDPVVTRREQLALLRGLGMNRLSMGVQDLDPDVQRAVHREQGVDLTRATLSDARELGYQSVNFDLIYGLPFQTPDSWRRTIEKVVAMRPDRVSVFSFAFVPDVKPHQRRLPVDHMPTGAAKLDLLRIAHDSLTGAGYRAIGMDHFALPDDELSLAQERNALGRDFQGYTVDRAPDTVAIGVTGISSIGGVYAQAVRSLGRHEASVTHGRLPTMRGHRLSEDDERRRGVITQLMCHFWVDLASARDAFAAELDDLRRLEGDGLCRVEVARVVLTPLGRVFVRNVAMVFDAYLRRRATSGAAAPTYSRTV